MDGATSNTSGLGGARIKRVGGSMNGACEREWRDFDHPLKAWIGG